MRRILCGHIFSAVLILIALSFVPRIADAESLAAISALGKDSVCVAIGDFSKDYTVGEPVEILSYGKVAATGKVVKLESSYMAVLIEKRSDDFFVREGDVIRKTVREKEKIRSLSAIITSETPTGIVQATVEKSSLSEVEDMKSDSKPKRQSKDAPGDSETVSETKKSPLEAFDTREKPIFDWYAGVPMTTGSAARSKKTAEPASE